MDKKEREDCGMTQICSLKNLRNGATIPQRKLGKEPVANEKSAVESFFIMIAF